MVTLVNIAASLMNDMENGGRRRLWQWLEACAPAFVCLDSRLLGAYRATLAELAADGWSPRPAAQDVEGSMPDGRRVAASAVG